MDFMNLNQSAHGDREFAFIQTRLRRGRKTVVGPLAGPAGRGAARLVDAGGGRLARVAPAADRALRRQHARGRGHRRRQGRGAGPARLLGQRLRRRRPRRARRGGPRRRGRPPGRRVRRPTTTLAPALRAGGDRHAELRTAARIEAGLRSFLDDGGFGAFTDTFEDLGALEQLPGIGVQRLMADGYGFGAEGDWKAAALVRILKVMGDGLPGGTSFMEDYTYHLGDPVPEVLGAHMLEVCPSIAAGKPSCEIHPLSIGGRADPVRLVFDAAPGPGRRRRPRRPRRPLPADRQRGRPRRARRAAAAAPGRARGLAAAARPADRRRGLAHGRRAAPHRADDDAADRGARPTSPRSPASSS